MCGIASSLNFPTIAFLLNIDPIYKTGALWQQRAGFVVAGQGSDENIKLATYTKDIGKVITDREVMDKDEFGYL